MKTRVIHLAIACLGLLLALPSCKKDELCTPSLNLEVFDSQLRTSIPSGLKGYTYLIMKDGKVYYTHSEGYARSPQDGLQHWDELQKMHVASISKTITTVATLRLLKQKGISPEEPIASFLPPDWHIGPYVDQISFRDLMRHKAGFLGVIDEAEYLSTSWTGLKTMVAHGANGFKTRKYSNVHHALLRVILPVLWNYPHSSVVSYDENYTAMRYEQIVNELVFDPLGISADLKDDDPNGGVLAYSSATDFTGEFELFNYTQKAGGYGWVLSARDLAKFWAYLWHSDLLLDDTQRDYMRTYYLGLWNSGETVNGTYYCKLGGWFINRNGQEHWLRSAAIEFPDGTGVVLFVNSPSSRGLRTAIVEAYENSFGCF